MATITRILKVGSDGNVVVPIGTNHAGEDVKVDVSPVAPIRRATAMTAEEYRAYIESLAGQWVGDFEEPADLPLEQREEL